MTINATAATLLCAVRRGRPTAGHYPSRAAGTIQNDILKEYIARGTYIYPPAPSMRLVTDTFAYCRGSCPPEHDQHQRLSHAGGGGDAVQEVAFTIADGIAYVEAARPPGSPSSVRPPPVVLLRRAQRPVEEAAKFRAARRLWARVVRDRSTQSA